MKNILKSAKNSPCPPASRFSSFQLLRPHILRQARHVTRERSSLWEVPHICHLSKRSKGFQRNSRRKGLVHPRPFLAVPRRLAHPRCIEVPVPDCRTQNTRTHTQARTNKNTGERTRHKMPCARANRHRSRADGRGRQARACEEKTLVLCVRGQKVPGCARAAYKGGRSSARRGGRRSQPFWRCRRREHTPQRAGSRTCRRTIISTAREKWRETTHATTGEK
jgi:hypothetical protein